MKRVVWLWLALLSPGLGTAEVVRYEIRHREAVLEGRAFGLAGGYEKISGLAHFAVDPAIDPNLRVTDIEKAPVNDKRLVEFSAEFYVLKPIHAERGNGAVLLEVGNCGRKGLFSFFNLAEGSLDPETTAHFGDGFLMHEGYTLVWVGWQWDTPEIDGLMRMHPPVATENGRPLRGLVRSDFVPSEGESDHSLADRNHIAYPVADPDAPENVLTVRDDVEAERRVIPRSRWKFARLEAGEVVPDPRRVHLEGGFEPFKIYEVVYVSENPPLVGMGPVAIRDFASQLK